MTVEESGVFVFFVHVDIVLCGTHVVAVVTCEAHGLYAPGLGSTLSGYMWAEGTGLYLAGSKRFYSSKWAN
jgi:hypothetical protein